MSWKRGSHDTADAPGGGTPPSAAKMSAMICSKLAKTFAFETATPAGVRVEPEVYCKYAVSDPVVPVERGPRDDCRASRSSRSISMIDGAVCPGCACAY